MRLFLMSIVNLLAKEVKNVYFSQQEEELGLTICLCHTGPIIFL